jgi:two-component system OmpR family response regulator
VNPRILIVDDDEGFLKILGEYLSACGFEPELACGAAQARNWLARSKFDVVLSDFQMPGESGLDLLCHVKALYSGLPFILMTGSGSSRLKHEAMEMGSSGFMEKPFRVRDLVATIAAFQPPDNQKTRELAS